MVDLLAAQAGVLAADELAEAELARRRLRERLHGVRLVDVDDGGKPEHDDVVSAAIVTQTLGEQPGRLRAIVEARAVRTRRWPHPPRKIPVPRLLR